MTRDEITRLAHQAGFVGMDGHNVCLRRFAEIVAAAEREACANVVEDCAMQRLAENMRMIAEDDWSEFDDPEEVRNQIEICAKAAAFQALMAAHAIRARGKA